MNDSIRHREALAAGIGRGELNGRSWNRVSHGLYERAGSSTTLADRCRQLSPLLPPDAAMSHLTGADLMSCWLPRLPRWLPVLSTIPPGTQRPERAGLYVARSRAALPAPVWVEGVPVLAPERLIGQLAEDLQLVDLVVAVDSFLHRKMCTLDQITDSLRSRQRGLPILRRALALCDGRSESAWETILRLLHVLAEVPVEPQYLIRDHEGDILARADLRVSGTHRLPEYDGADHRLRPQHERDLSREKVLGRHRFERYGYTSVEILVHPGLIIRDAEDALGWRHDPSRIEPWRVAFERSSLSALGWRRLLRRLHRFDKPLRGRGTRRKPVADCGNVQGDTPQEA